MPEPPAILAGVVKVRLDIGDRSSLPILILGLPSRDLAGDPKSLMTAR